MFISYSISDSKNYRSYKSSIRNKVVKNNCLKSSSLDKYLAELEQITYGKGIV